MSGSSKQKQENKIEIPDFFKPYYNQALTGAQNLYQSGGFAPVVGMSDETSRGLQDNMKFADYLESSFLPRATTSFNSMLESSLIDSPELQRVIASSTRPVMDQLSRYTLPTTQDAAIMAGQRGSSRQGVAEGLARSEANNTMGDIASRLSLQALLQDQQNKQFGISNMPAFMQALQTPASLRTTVGGIKEGYQEEAANAPANNLLQYAQIVQAMNPGVNSTTTTTSKMSNFQKLAALGNLAIQGYSAFKPPAPAPKGGA
jgi:hypothetical protein